MKDYNNEEEHFEEPKLEDFFMTEEQSEKELKRKKHRIIIGRMIAFTLAFALLISGLAVWTSVFNLPSFSFLKESNELSKIENIQDYKEAVVTIEGGNRKGTGFNISSDGQILTNYHVIENLSAITVYFANGEIFSAGVVEAFPELDIAILETDGKGLPYLELQKNQPWHEEDSIYVIGNPLAYNRIVMEGKIKDSVSGQIRITAQIEKGNSGSPVIDKYGKVIGVVFAKTIPSIGSEEDSLGLVVPIDLVLEKSQTLKK